MIKQYKRLCYYLILMMPLVFILSCQKHQSIPAHPALIIMNHYQSVSNGSYTVVPFQANVMALDLLQKTGTTASDTNKTITQKTIISECQQYIQWYLNHTNPSDTYGLSGTIYSYEVSQTGTEQMEKDNEPLDRTAASFILLVHRFYQATGYKQMISQSREKIANVAYLIPHLQDEKDGLIRTYATSTLKLLENNCWDYAAMDSFMQLATIFHWEKPEFYQDTRDSIADAVLEKFYRPKHSEFYWQIDGPTHQLQAFAVDWNTLFPDGYSQLFPLLFDIIPAEEKSTRAQLWNTFHNHYHTQLEKEIPDTLIPRIIYQWTTHAMLLPPRGPVLDVE